VLEWDESRPIPHDELLTRVRDVDALLCTAGDVISRDIIDASTRLRVISTMSDEYAHIDVAAAAARGIAVCHTPGAVDEAVADMTVALLLACARNIVDAYLFMKNREWRYLAHDLFLGTEVQGTMLGIIGFEHTGIQVAHRALGFGMRVRYYDNERNHDAEERLGVEYAALDDILREADFVTLHLPPQPKYAHLINERRLRLMKPSAYLINMAHGLLIDHDALVRALREGWIAGAGLDVFAQEPLPMDDPLLDLGNVVLSPHISANTLDGIGTVMRMAAEQVIDVLQGRRPSHPVVWRKRAA
jgi:glyoxylate reductase